MKKAIKVVVFPVICLLTLLSAQAVGFDSTVIDEVRNRVLVGNASLTSTDQKVISDFVDSAFDQMLTALTLSEVVDARNAVIAEGPGAKPSKYGLVYISAVKNKLKIAFAELNSWEDSEIKMQVQTNFMVLTAQLESMELVDYGIAMADSEDMMLRYWAVKSLVNVNVAGQLTSSITGDAVVLNKVIQTLQKVSEKETVPEIFRIMIYFAGSVKDPGCEAILLKIAKKRIAEYREWTVRYELIDAALMRALSKKIESATSEQNKAVIGRNIGQLYSFVIQRYILGQSFLDEDSQGYLASVIVETEASVITKLLKRPQAGLTKAIGKRSLTLLAEEHDALLGTAARPGQLGFSLKFDYGKQSSGAVKTGPEILKNPVENTVDHENNG